MEGLEVPVEDLQDCKILSCWEISSFVRGSKWKDRNIVRYYSLPEEKLARQFAKENSFNCSHVWLIYRQGAWHYVNKRPISSELIPRAVAASSRTSPQEKTNVTTE